MTFTLKLIAKTNERITEKVLPVCFELLINSATILNRVRFPLREKIQLKIVMLRHLSRRRKSQKLIESMN